MVREDENSTLGQSRCIAYHLVRGLLGGAEDGGDALVDVGVGGGPIADADAHGGLILPDGAAAPAGSVFLNGGDGALGLFRGAEGDEDLIEDDFVEDLMAGGAQGVGEAAGLAAIALDHFGQALTAEGADGGVDGHCAGAARFFRDEFVGVALRAGSDDVGGGERHGAAVGELVGAEDDAAVVGNVEPLVCIGGDGVGQLDATDQVEMGGRGGGPEAEGAVNVQPGTALLSQCGDFGERIDCAGVDVAGLSADDAGSLMRAQVVGQRVGAHAALVVGRDFVHAIGAETEQAQGHGDGVMRFFVDCDLDGRSAEETVGFDVPACVGEDAMTGSGEAGEVGHLAAGDEAEAHGGGQAGELAQPGAGDLLDDRDQGGQHVDAAVLIPCGDEPVGGECGGKSASDDEAEVAWAGGRDGALHARGGEDVGESFGVRSFEWEGGRRVADGADRR